MINYFIKFLICFKKPVPPPKKEPKGKKAAEQKSPRKTGKEKKMDEVEAPKGEPPEEKDENVISCENAREWCHIEYTLLPDVLPVIEINVVTWGEVAKVVTNEDCRVIKTAVVGNLVWVYFEVHHKTNPFTNDNLAKFKESKIKFTFSQDNKKMMPDVANDWPKQFIFCDNKDNSESKGNTRWFSELRQIDPPEEKYDSLSYKFDTFRISRPDTTFIVTMLNIKLFEKRLESKLYEVTASLPTVEESPDTTNAKKKEKPSKKVTSEKETKAGKKGKVGQIQEATNQLFVAAEHLIAGKYNASAERKEISQTLKYAAVFVNSSKVLTDEQDVTYVPFIVNLPVFEALPLKKLEEHNIQKVFARYAFADVIDEMETPKMSPRENISVDDIRVFFLSNPEEQLEHETLMLRPSMMRLAEALLTRRFVVNVYGETERVEEEVVPSLFGDRPTDPFISTPGHEMFLNYKPPCYSPEIFLGSSSFNLIQLIKGYSIVEATSVMTSSPFPYWGPICDVDMTDAQNEEERKTLMLKLLTPGVILDSIFLEYNSRIRLKVSTPCQLTVPENHQLINIPEVSQRAIIIFKDTSFNDEVVNIIERANRGLHESLSNFSIRKCTSVRFIRQVSPSQVTVMSTRLSHCNKLNQTLQELRRRVLFPDTSINGFFVEHEKESMLVFEAMIYIIPSVIEQIQLLFKSEDSARIICDSSIFFTKKLYMDFRPKHIFRIRLPVSLDALLKEPSYYTKQSMLEESLQTLLMLDLLRRCGTVNTASVNQLFPSYNQLVSFYEMFSIKEN